MNNATQTRGHCQRCGALQAVNGSMAHHGYTVKDGYFSGKCQGHMYAPIEVSRVEADRVIAEVLADAAQNDAYVADLQAGRVHPPTVPNGSKLVDGKRVDQFLPWGEADPYQQRRAREDHIFRAKWRARQARSFAAQMTTLCDTYHGKPLLVVTRASAAPRIEPGERRRHGGGDRDLLSLGQDGAKVYYSYTNGLGKTFKSTMSSRSWRALPLVA